MIEAKSEKLSSPCSWLPFGYFCTILKLGVQHVGGASPNLEALKVSAVVCNRAKELNGRPSMLSIWCMIVYPSGVIQSIWPKIHREYLRPMDA